MSRLHVWQRDMAEAGADPVKRLAVLVRYAEIRVEHRIPKDPKVLARWRRWFRRTPARSFAGYCGVCGVFEGLDRHHVIQLQHGGVDNHLNIIDICRACHEAVHPWMKHTKRKR